MQQIKSSKLEMINALLGSGENMSRRGDALENALRTISFMKTRTAPNVIYYAKLGMAQLPRIASHATLPLSFSMDNAFFAIKPVKPALGLPIKIAFHAVRNSSFLMENACRLAQMKAF